MFLRLFLAGLFCLCFLRLYFLYLLRPQFLFLLCLYFFSLCLCFFCLHCLSAKFFLLVAGIFTLCRGLPDLLRGPYLHVIYIHRHVIPHHGIFMAGFILQNDSVDAPEVLRNSGIFFRVVQLIINSRVHIVHGTLPDSYTSVSFFVEQIQLQSFFPFHMQSFAVNMYHAIFVSLLYLDKSYVA